MKTCTKCKVEKEASEFYKHTLTSDRLRGECKACFKLNHAVWRANNKDKIHAYYKKDVLKHRARSKEWMRANPEKRKDRRLQTKYGITLEQYNDLFAIQAGCCVICEQHQSSFKNALAVDHDHSTGSVRGLLCKPCNLSLGLFKDRPKALENAIAYLNKAKLKLVKNG